VRLLLLLVFLAAMSPALGRWEGVDVERIPVARLIENLEKIAKDNPASAEALLNLGRAHGMAYAQKSDPLEVPTAYHGIAPPAVPFNEVTTVAIPSVSAEGCRELLFIGSLVQPSLSEIRIDFATVQAFGPIWASCIAAQTHLEAALKAYQQALELDKDNLVIRLGLAWLTEQAGRKDDAVRQYRTIATDAWEKEKSLKALGFSGRTLTGEVASYLVPLLDPEKDKGEIETLKDHVATIRKLPHAVTPIAVPLADGLTPTDLEAPDARVTFDVDGSGLGREWSWITPKAAWLVSDPTRDGKIDSGRQLFGNVTFWMFWNSGYAPLAALDDDRDGILTGKELAGLALWHDANSNGVADPGEVKPVSAYGIVAISCKWQTLNNNPDKVAFSPNGVVFQDGKTRPSFDLVLKAQLGFQVTLRASDALRNSP
jgi:Tetratricopeptide repeat